jgi:hypothetical protein
VTRPRVCGAGKCNAPVPNRNGGKHPDYHGDSSDQYDEYAEASSSHLSYRPKAESIICVIARAFFAWLNFTT